MRTRTNHYALQQNIRERKRVYIYKASLQTFQTKSCRQEHLAAHPVYPSKLYVQSGNKTGIFEKTIGK